jgi:PEP-CTERM motif
MKTLKPIVSLAGLAALCSLATPSHALSINFTYDASVAANFNGSVARPNNTLANFQSAANKAALAFTSVFNDPISVNITMSAAAGTSILGQSSSSIFQVSYTNLRNAVVADATSADDALAIGATGSVVAADPNVGGTWWVTKAQRKALGLAANDATNDGTCTFGEGFTYDFDPSNGIGAGQIDMVGVMMHEVSEVMGRIGISLGAVGAFTNSVTLLDNFSYSSAGVKALGNPAGNYFSIDRGTTNLKEFNSVPGGDTRDWASGSNDAFNAFSSSGVVNPFTAVGLQSMDVIGYTLIPTATPEPGTLALVALGGFAGLLLKRRNRTA